MKGELTMLEVLKQDYNMKNVTKGFEERVEKILKSEDGTAKKITTNEYFALQDFFAKNVHTMNDDQIAFVNNKLVEYAEKKEKEFVKNEVSDNAKNAITSAAKAVDDKTLSKKKIDHESEAKQLLDSLNDPNQRGKFSANDRMYILATICKSGYGYLLDQEPKTNVTIVNVNVTAPQPFAFPPNNCEPKTEPNPGKGTSETQKNTVPHKDTEKPIKDKNSAKKEADRAAKEADKATKEADRAKKEADRSAREADRSAKEADRSEKAAEKSEKAAEKAEKAASKPKVSPKAEAEGFGMANTIIDELKNIFKTDDDKIQKAIQKINKTNAYSFVGRMISGTENSNVLGAVRKHITNREVTYIVSSLLNQAATLGLKHTQAYKELFNRYIISKEADENDMDATPEEKTTQKTDEAIKKLYEEMTKAYTS